VKSYAKTLLGYLALFLLSLALGCAFGWAC